MSEISSKEVENAVSMAQNALKVGGYQALPNSDAARLEQSILNAGNIQAVATLAAAILLIASAANSEK